MFLSDCQYKTCANILRFTVLINSHKHFYQFWWHLFGLKLQSVVVNPDGSFGSFLSNGACNLKVPGLNPGRAGYLSLWLCIYSASDFSKSWSVQCRLWYCALLKNP